MRDIDEAVFAVVPDTHKKAYGHRMKALDGMEKQLVCFALSHAQANNATPGNRDVASKMLDVYFGLNLDEQPETLRPILFDVGLGSPKLAKSIMEDLGDLNALVAKGGVDLHNVICDIRAERGSDWDRMRAKQLRHT